MANVKILLIAALLSTAASAGVHAATPAEISADKLAIDAVITRDYPRLEALYRDIHMHPEISFQETATAAKLAREMRELGFTVTEHVGQTGIVAIFRNGPGPTVMVRTELDALPMEEKTGLPYASRAKANYQGKETFVAHSCGHDIHMASWVGTARALIALKEKWHGTLMFIGQPSEEGVSGAEAMVKDKLFERFGKPDFGLALHVSNAPVGQVSYKPGIWDSNSDGFNITFNGVGGHGSRPELTIDPIMMAGRFIVDVQSVVSREKDSAAFGVVSIGSVHAGSAANIIPDSATLSGTIRAFELPVSEKLIAGVERTAKAVSTMAGAPPPDVRIRHGARAVVNDAALTARVGAVFASAFGPDAVAKTQPGSASEDYSVFIMAGVPSVYFGIGGYDAARIAAAAKAGVPLPGNHSPYFAPAPEPSIRTGVEAMTLAVLEVLAPKQ